jgi:hypothetical protein
VGCTGSGSPTISRRRINWRRRPRVNKELQGGEMNGFILIFVALCRSWKKEKR